MYYYLPQFSILFNRINIFWSSYKSSRSLLLKNNYLYDIWDSFYGNSEPKTEIYEECEISNMNGNFYVYNVNFYNHDNAVIYVVSLYKPKLLISNPFFDSNKIQVENKALVHLNW